MDSIENLEIFGDVINGRVYDKTTLNATIANTYVFPDNAVIEVKQKGKDIEIFIRKILSFHGHPPGPITVLDAREAMGVAHRTNDNQLVLATYGEWGSIEGGANIRLLIKIPQEVSYSTRQGLSGPESEAHRDRSGLFGREGYINWYGDTKPREGWTAVKTNVDNGMTVKQVTGN